MLAVMLRRLLFPPGMLALYFALAAARVAYWPTQVFSPDTARAMTSAVDRWMTTFTRWCQPAG